MSREQSAREGTIVPAVGRTPEAAPKKWGARRFGVTLLAGSLALGVWKWDDLKGYLPDNHASQSPDGVKVQMEDPQAQEKQVKEPKYTFESQAAGVFCTGKAVKVTITKADKESPLRAFYRTTHEPWKFMENGDGQVYKLLEDLSNWEGHNNPTIEDKMPKGTVIYVPSKCKVPVMGEDDMRP